MRHKHLLEWKQQQTTYFSNAFGCLAHTYTDTYQKNSRRRRGLLGALADVYICPHRPAVCVAALYGYLECVLFVYMKPMRDSGRTKGECARDLVLYLMVVACFVDSHTQFTQQTRRRHTRLWGRALARRSAYAKIHSARRTKLSIS